MNIVYLMAGLCCLSGIMAFAVAHKKKDRFYVLMGIAQLLMAVGIAL